MTLSPLTTWNYFYQPCESMLINYKIEFVIFKDFFFLSEHFLGEAPKLSVAFT